MSYEYIRRAHYHETDQMGIIHHANYIKWFEEARISLLNDMGLPYSKMEEAGVLSPVLSVTCDFLAMVKFDDEVVIHVDINSYTGVRFTAKYDVTDIKGKITYAKGESKHCFVDKDMKIVRLDRAEPEMDRLFKKFLG